MASHADFCVALNSWLEPGWSMLPCLSMLKLWFSTWTSLDTKQHNRLELQEHRKNKGGKTRLFWGWLAGRCYVGFRECNFAILCVRMQMSSSAQSENTNEKTRKKESGSPSGSILAILHNNTKHTKETSKLTIPTHHHSISSHSNHWRQQKPQSSNRLLPQIRRHSCHLNTIPGRENTQGRGKTPKTG